jgi:hypothetical protein
MLLQVQQLLLWLIVASCRKAVVVGVAKLLGGGATFVNRVRQ